MQQKDIQALLQKYSAGTATPEERALVEAWYEQLDTQKTVNEDHLQEIEEMVFNRLPQPAQVRPLWPRIAVAASLILALSFGSYLIWHKPASQQLALNQQHDAAPGSNKAILTLANGQKIILNNMKNGVLSQQGSTQVNKLDSSLSYIANNTKTEEVLYNTMTTPRGGKYDLILGDGTHVWLNAASSITYPVAFNGKERKVTITGEAYFEVAHDASKPFQVTTNGETVEVLGTHFNINSYSDEPSMKTTLLQGSVRVSMAAEIAMLKPGQQSIIKPGSDKITVSEADTEEATAWIKGYFDFDRENLGSVMRKVSRWYNVDVEYREEGVKAQLFAGTMSRYANLSSVLKTLELTNAVHFKIEGNKLIVMH
jgi:ferric-dicitrate binding protein FerR (iron transport regulator)